MNFENTGLLSSTDGAFASEIHWPPKLRKVKLTIHTSNYRVPYFAYVVKSQHNLLLILYIKLQLGYTNLGLELTNTKEGKYFSNLDQPI